MEKIAILIDSASDINLDLMDQMGIYLLPLYVNLDGEYYKDRVDLSPDEFYDWVKDHKTLAKTSTASPGDIINLYEKIKADGYNKVIAISLNTKFSSTHSVMEMTKIDGLDTYVFDSANLTMAEGFFAIYAKRLIDEGKSFDQIIENLEAKKNDSRVFFSIQSFKYIVEGGRLHRSLGRVGDALSVRPILSLNPIDGAFKVVKIARGEKRVLSELKKHAKNELKNVNDYYFFIGHGGYKEGIEKLEDIFADIIKGAKDFYKVQISPTLGANTGPGLFGFGLFKLD